MENYPYKSNKWKLHSQVYNLISTYTCQCNRQKVARVDKIQEERTKRTEEKLISK